MCVLFRLPLESRSNLAMVEVRSAWGKLNQMGGFSSGS